MYVYWEAQAAQHDAHMFGSSVGRAVTGVKPTAGILGAHHFQLL